MTLPQPFNINDLQPFFASPELLREQTVELQLAIANYPATPRNFLELLANSSDPLVATAASHHVNWAGEITENWQQIADVALQTLELGQNDRLAVELLKIAPVADYFLSEWVPASYLTQALKNPYLPLRYRLKYLERLAGESNIKSRFEVAEFRETPPQVLEILAGDVELLIRMAAQSNPSCPQKLIKLMERKLAVAQDWNTDSEQLATLGKSRWNLIRLTVAQNPATSGETLMQLARDGVFKIKLAVAKNPQTPANILEVLAEHWEAQINSEVARHPNVTEEILHKLFPIHKSVLRETDNLPASILELFFGEFVTNDPIWKQYELQNLLLRQSNTPTWILAELANVNLEAVRAEKEAQYLRYHNPPEFIIENWKVQSQIRFLVDVVKHPQVSVEILEQLSDCPHPEILRAVGHNPRSPESLRNKIAQSLRVDVGTLRSIANEPLETKNAVSQAKNKTLDSSSLPPLECYRLLLEKGQQEEKARADKFISTRTRERTPLTEVMKSNDSQTLWSAARSSHAPIHILEQLAQHPDATVRSALLDNEALPSNIMLKLAYDSSVSVRSKLATKDRDYRQAPETPTPVEILEMLADDESEGVRAVVAGNPDTPVETLVKLGNDSSENVKNKLVSNPNTPVEILERLGLEEGIFDVRNANTPGNVLEKAVRKLWEFNDPKSQDKLENLLKYPVGGSQMPASVLDELSDHGYSAIRCRVADHRNTSSKTLEKLHKDDYFYVRTGVAKNPNTPPYLLEKMARREDPKDEHFYGITICIAQRHETPATALEFLANSPKISKFPILNIHEIVAKNPNTPSTALETLAKTESDIRTLKALTQNPNLTARALQQLANNSNDVIRIALIERPELPSELWQKLAEDENATVRRAIASSTTTPVNILEDLTLDTDTEVRRRVAANPNTPIISLDILSQDSIAEVRIAVAANQNSNVIVLEQLAQDKKVEVRRAVAKNPNTPDVLQKSLEDSLGLPYVRQPSTTLSGLSRIYNPDTDDLPTLLSEYAESDNAFVRFVTLMHPLTPVDTIMEGYQSLFWQERYAVAENPSTLREIREQLANDSNRIVRAAAKANL